MLTRKQIKNFLIGTLCLMGSYSIHATTIDLTGQGSNGGGYGNQLTFSQDGINVNVSAFAETGSEFPPSSQFYLFETAEVYSWSTGLGVCNQDEGIVGAGCVTNEHELDTVRRDDLLVLQFDQEVNFEFLTVDPFNGPGNDPNDRDIIYWVGNTNSMPDLTTQTFDTLDTMAGFSAETHESASSSFSPYTHVLSGTGNVLLLSGNYHDLGCRNRGGSNSSCEEFKISDITVSQVSPVPVPAAIWLLASALVGLGFVRKSS